jgi:hypothetical protein
MHLEQECPFKHKSPCTHKHAPTLDFSALSTLLRSLGTSQFSRNSQPFGTLLHFFRLLKAFQDSLKFLCFSRTFSPHRIPTHAQHAQTPQLFQIFSAALDCLSTSQTCSLFLDLLMFQNCTHFRLAYTLELLLFQNGLHFLLAHISHILDLLTFQNCVCFRPI